jgi:hypothetical protein
MARKSTKKTSKPLKTAKKMAPASKKVSAKKAPAKKKTAAASNVIVVPKPAPGSYDPNRPLSKNTLLLHQVRHFQEVEQRLPEEEQTGHAPESITTEGQAAEYLRKMTAKLHPEGTIASEASKKLAKRGANG